MALDTLIEWSCSRCQAMVSGPASKPVVESFSRSSTISFDRPTYLVVGCSGESWMTWDFIEMLPDEVTLAAGRHEAPCVPDGAASALEVD